MVWARKHAASERCPKTVITADSAAFLEAFHIWKVTASPIGGTVDAREVEALLLLEQELQAEKNDARQQTR
ncbi:MAG TPA: hypothetical protein VLT57_19375 [Bryobacteraceae bacterium]|nr:hypothetical protein [Bryobacteraceae bacterium]